MELKLESATTHKILNCFPLPPFSSSPLIFFYFLPTCSNLPFKLKLCPLSSDPCYYLYPQHCHRLNPLTTQYSLQMFLCASYFIFKRLWTILNFLLNSSNIFSKKNLTLNPTLWQINPDKSSTSSSQAEDLFKIFIHFFTVYSDSSDKSLLFFWAPARLQSSTPWPGWY